MYREMKKLLISTGSGLKFIILLFFRSPVDLCMTVIQALFLQNAFNAIEQEDSGQLLFVCITFLIASFSIFLYNGTVWSIYAPFVVRMESKLHLKLFDKIARLSCERMEQTSQGEWVTRLNTDVQMPFSQPLHLPHAVNAILRILGSSLAIWMINPQVLGWVMLFNIPHIIISELFVAGRMPNLSKKAIEATAKNTGEFSTLINCAETAILYDGQDYLMKRFELSSREIVRTRCRMHRRGAFAALMMPLFRLSGYVVILIASSVWIANGNLSFGDLTGAFQFRGGVLIGSMMLLNSSISIRTSLAGIRRINETMEI